MLTLMWNVSAAIRGYLRFNMPTNIAIDLLRTPRGLKWAAPAALVAVPAYLFAMSLCATTVERGGPGWLNVLVVLFFWNAIKFASIAVFSPLLQLRCSRHRRLPAPANGSERDLMTQPGRRAVAVLDEPRLSRYT